MALSRRGPIKLDVAMAIPHDVLSSAPVGGALAPGGATFRIWAPRASAVYVSGDFNGWKQDAGSSLVQIGGGHWATFIPDLEDGAQYKFFIDGPGSSGYKRDPRGRVLTFQPAFPLANCIVRDPSRFPWHQAHFTPPRFNDLIIYQLHVGTYDIPAGDSDGSFLDVTKQVPYLAELGVNAIELLPIQIGRAHV